THHQVEVAQADVEIDDDHALPTLRQRRAERRCGGRLADAAFSAGHDQNLGHSDVPLQLRQSSGAMTIESRSSQACTGRPRKAGSMSSAVRYSPSIASNSASMRRQKMRAFGLPSIPAMARPRSAP